MKNKPIDQIHIDDCPMAYDNCLSCPFFCGTTVCFTSERSEQVRCGWNRKIQEMMTLKK